MDKEEQRGRARTCKGQAKDDDSDGGRDDDDDYGQEKDGGLHAKARRRNAEGSPEAVFASGTSHFAVRWQVPCEDFIEC